LNILCLIREVGIEFTSHKSELGIDFT